MDLIKVTHNKCLICKTGLKKKKPQCWLFKLCCQVVQTHGGAEEYFKHFGNTQASLTC